MNTASAATANFRRAWMRSRKRCSKDSIRRAPACCVWRSRCRPLRWACRAKTCTTLAVTAHETAEPEVDQRLATRQVEGNRRRGRPGAGPAHTPRPLAGTYRGAPARRGITGIRARTALSRVVGVLVTTAAGDLVRVKTIALRER